MKVIKRDGREAEYDRNKIVHAIQKANNEVEKEDKISEEKIYDIVASIENRKLASMAVEDIQDIIEQKLMEEGKYHLAKKYIIYRYTRAMVREIQHHGRFHSASDPGREFRIKNREF